MESSVESTRKVKRRTAGLIVLLTAAAAATLWRGRDAVLLYLAIAGRRQPARLFVTYGSNINSTGSAGFGILHAAALLNDPELVRDATSRGASVDARSQHGDTALIVASSLGHAEAVRALVAAGANVNAVGANLDTPLAAAVANGKRSAVEELIAAGAACKVPPPSRSLRELAIAGQHRELLPLLARCGEM